MLNTSLNVARQGEVAPLIRFYEDPLDEDSAEISRSPSRPADSSASR
jgi:hypothetical protein